MENQLGNNIYQSCAIYRNDWFFLGFNKDVQKEPSKAVAQSEISGRGGFGELGHFDKHFVKNLRKKGLAGENFGVFSPRYS